MRVFVKPMNEYGKLLGKNFYDYVYHYIVGFEDGSRCTFRKDELEFSEEGTK